MAGESMDPARRPENNADDGTTAAGQGAEEPTAPADHEMEVDAEASNEMNTDIVGNVTVASGLGKMKPAFDDEVPALLLGQMGSTGRSYRRKGCKAARRILGEVYSPPRIAKLIRDIRNRHMLQGYALDLTTVDPDDGLPWDFSRQSKRMKARQILRQQRPYMLI